MFCTAFSRPCAGWRPAALCAQYQITVVQRSPSSPSSATLYGRSGASVRTEPFRPTGITVASTAVYTARATLAPPLRARAPSCGLLKDLLAWGGASGASVNWRYDVLEMHARELDRRIRASTERPAMADTASVLSDGVAVHGPDQNAFAHAVGRALGRMCRGGGGVEERSGACAQRLGGPRHTTGSTVQRFACAASAHVP